MQGAQGEREQVKGEEDITEKHLLHNLSQLMSKNQVDLELVGSEMRMRMRRMNISQDLRLVIDMNLLIQKPYHKEDRKTLSEYDLQ